jgi:hypothetical protein
VCDPFSMRLPSGCTHAWSSLNACGTRCGALWLPVWLPSGICRANSLVRGELTSDPLLERHHRRIAGSRLMSSDEAFSCGFDRRKSRGVAQGLSLLAPCLAPRTGMPRSVQTAENDCEYGMRGGCSCGRWQRQGRERATWREPSLLLVGHCHGE